MPSCARGKFMQSTKMVLEVGVGGERDVLDAAGDHLGAGALGLGDQRELGARARRRCRRSGCATRAGRAGSARCAARSAPTGSCRSRPPASARRPARSAPRPRAGAWPIAGGDRALAELDLPDVVLGEHDLPLRAGSPRPGEHHQALLAAHLDTPPGMGAGSRSRRVDVDEAGPVDARPGRAAAATASRSPEPQSPCAGASPIVWRRRSPSATLDAVDGPDGRAHAVADLGALERGAGGGRAGPQPLARAQQHLAVGADVDRDAEGRASRRCGWRAPPRPRRRPRSRPRAAAGRRAPRDDSLRNSSRAGSDQRVPHHRRVRGQAHVGRDRCRGAGGACRCCRRSPPCRSTWRARRTRA